MAQHITLTEADRDTISAAVAAAELRSAGEIVTIVTERSDRYHDVALVWSAFVAFLALTVYALFSGFYLSLIDRLLGHWQHDWTPREVLALATLAATLKFTGMWLMQQWQPLRLFLVPAPLKHARVRGRAITLFRVGAERRTTGRTGILIYLSLAERRAEIVADEAIASKVAPDVWGEAMAAMLAEIKAGRVGAGMAAAVSKVGDVLAQHLPRSADDRNELPDRVIEV
jgi:putative membrane protein